ncbi:hypothetical protein ACFO0E_05090 [Chromohalobacter beijerinckii]|uniref:Transposase n=1 Tax=Chromohalobacter beijerinckii TaxID=86179 RepID=A0ABV8XCD4_9GAMM
MATRYLMGYVLHLVIETAVHNRIQAMNWARQNLGAPPMVSLRSPRKARTS